MAFTASKRDLSSEMRENISFTAAERNLSSETGKIMTFTAVTKNLSSEIGENVTFTAGYAVEQIFTEVNGRKEGLRSFKYYTKGKFI